MKVYTEKKNIPTSCLYCRFKELRFGDTCYQCKVWGLPLPNEFVETDTKPYECEILPLEDYAHEIAREAYAKGFKDGQVTEATYLQVINDFLTWLDQDNESTGKQQEHARRLALRFLKDYSAIKK